MKNLLAIFTLCFVACLNTTVAQNISSVLLTQSWQAEWITGPGNPVNMWSAKAEPSLSDYGVYKFRKKIDLAAKPSTFIVHVSGDNRYKLYVNEQLVALGPARGDLYFWHYETVDLAPYLKAGNNTIAALIWHDGKQKPEAQISYLAAFIMQGNTDTEAIINTNATWKAAKDSSYTPLTPRVPGYYVAGPGELVDMNKHLKGWETSNYDDSGWQKPRVIMRGLPKTASIDARGWMLIPSPIKQAEVVPQRLVSVRSTEGGVNTPAQFPKEAAPFTIPARTQVKLLLDQTYLTNAYPTMRFSKGKNAGISLSYAEALYIHKGEKLDGGWVPTLPKGNRNDIAGKIFIGKKDSIISDGSDNQVFMSLWWRTYRYIQVLVTTQDEPLVIEDLYGFFTGYPFQNVSTFETGSQEHQDMLNIGWRTARLCAFETYMDCPYYEQLQYIGDARIQALVTLYNTRDDAFVRQALDLMDRSRLAEGITLSRYPTDLHQQIPTFSLWYIGMLHDYWRYRPDSLFIKDKLNGARAILDWFGRYQDTEGSLQNVPYWIFTDWVEGKTGWRNGIAPLSKTGHSAVLDMQLMWTFLVAADLEQSLGLKDLAAQYRSKANQLKQVIIKKYWDKNKNLFADTEDKNLFSQHTNALAILSGIVQGKAAADMARTLFVDKTLTQASIYFKYYVHQAAVKAGLGNEYLDWLTIWRENIKMGLTTWAEISEIDVARSDCHAWGSSPNIEFYRVVLGIDSEAAGFKKVKIQPHLGQLTQAKGSIPHPNGLISTDYQLKNNVLNAVIILPKNTTGRFVWKGKTYLLKSGIQTLVLK